jgi:hypothetical protein
MDNIFPKEILLDMVLESKPTSLLVRPYIDSLITEEGLVTYGTATICGITYDKRIVRKSTTISDIVLTCSETIFILDQRISKVVHLYRIVNRITWDGIEFSTIASANQIRYLYNIVHSGKRCTSIQCLCRNHDANNKVADLVGIPTLAEWVEMQHL